jgi:hypothetical protein
VLRKVSRWSLLAIGILSFVPVALFAQSGSGYARLLMSRRRRLNYANTTPSSAVHDRGLARVV